ncbi:hypothetical protein BH23THE1_BH23THE1_11350 [soil metagenome]
MNKWYLRFFVLVAMIGLGSCKKDNSGNRFDMIYPELYFTIPAGLNPFLIHFIEIRNIPLNKAFYFNQNNVQDPSSTRIQPRSARITSIFGDVDFEFIERISVLVSSTENPNQYVEAYYRDPVPLNAGNFLDLIPTLLDLQQIITTDSLNVRIRMQLRSPSPVFVESRLDYTFFGETEN